MILFRANRRGFTTIELMVVIGIMVLMVSLAVPSMAESLQRTKVSNAANAIQEAHTQARFLARTEGPPSATAAVSGQSHYGVLIDASHVEVTFGGGTFLDGAGKPVMSVAFRSDVAAVMTGASSWEYQYGTGYPIQQGAHGYAVPGVLANAVNIGTPNAADAVNTKLEVRTVDGTASGRHHAAVRIYKSGLCHVELE